MKKNKIIIVSPSLDPLVNVSGVSSVVNFIIKYSDREYIHFELGKKDNEKRDITRFLKLLVQLFSWIIFLNKYKRCIIHYNFALNKASIIRDSLFMFIAKTMGRKMVIHIHGGMYIRKKKTGWIRIILKQIFNWNYPIILLSKEEKDILQSEFDIPKVYSLPNCIDIGEASKFNRNQKVLSDQPLKVLYLGRIEVNKGMDYLLEAFKSEKIKRTKIELHIAGKEENSEEYIPAFKKAIGHKFCYHGVVFGETKTQLLKECDIFILPSFFEGLPMALLEAMSFGLVPITTDVGSINTCVMDNETGFFIKKKDCNSIIDRLCYLYENHSEISRLSKNAKKIIEEHFNPTKYIDVLDKIYESCVE